MQNIIQIAKTAWNIKLFWILNLHIFQETLMPEM